MDTTKNNKTTHIGILNRLFRIKKILALLVGIALYASFTIPSSSSNAIDYDDNPTPQELEFLQRYERRLLESKIPTSPAQQANNVLVTLSIGESAAKSPMVERCHRSVRNPGNFKGYFAVITDAPEGNYKELEEKDDKFIVLQIREEDKRRDIDPYLAMKLFKTMIPKYVYGHEKLSSANHVTYLDFDIVVGEDMNKIYDLLDTRKTLDIDRLKKKWPEYAKDEMSTIYFFAELYGHHRNQPFHGGVFFLDKNSQHCLDLWADEIVNNDGESSRDQVALNHLNQKILRREVEGCKLYAIPRAHHISYPTESFMKHRLTSTFIHTTNTHRANIIPKELQEEYFADVMGFTEEERRKHMTLAATTIGLNKNDFR